MSSLHAHFLRGGVSVKTACLTLYFSRQVYRPGAWRRDRLRSSYRELRQRSCAHAFGVGSHAFLRSSTAVRTI